MKHPPEGDPPKETTPYPPERGTTPEGGTPPEGDPPPGIRPRGKLRGSSPGPHPRGKLRGIRSRPTSKGEIEGDQIQAHTQGEIEGDQIWAHTQGGNWGGSPWHTVNERPVRILLECILVCATFLLINTCVKVKQNFSSKVQRYKPKLTADGVGFKFYECISRICACSIESTFFCKKLCL